MRLALVAVTLLFASMPIVLPKAAQAEQYVSGGHVVHTRRLPVIAHRVVPPFRGVHVYGGRRR